MIEPMQQPNNMPIPKDQNPQSAPFRYPRDMLGYGANPPNAKWPNKARIAVQFVINYEEGGENNVLHGDEASEAFLSDVIGAQPWPGQRHWNMESMYEYGSRAGFWRLHRLFTQKNVPVTVYGVTTALARGPAQVQAMKDAGWEIASHGLKWVEHKDIPADTEYRMVEEALELHELVTGERPRGWYTGRCSSQTVDIVSEIGNLDYISDTYDDDLPYWREHNGKPQLIIPYTLEANDMRFTSAQGFNSGDQFFTYLKDAFDTLYEEGKNGSPKMMTIGLHCRIIGRPGRIAALARFIDYIQQHKKVWTPRRIDIAEHWFKTHPYEAPSMQPSRMDYNGFMQTFGSIFEHSPFVAERAYQAELGPANDTAIGMFQALAMQFRAASDEEKLGVLQAHPDLAGKLAQAERLTEASTSEQASAGLNALTDEERETFTALNTAYTQKFGFPFIIAVKDNTKASILEAFNKRIENTYEEELREAQKQVERIAYLRLTDILPA